jgi:HD-GYP domain-containing protein (c-di-GMP phosphodiesterase class II)
MDRKVSTANLKPGMYVSRLDRPWVTTPFMIQGFFIEDQSDIAKLASYCDFVYIDTDMGETAEMYLDQAPSGSRTQVRQRLASNRQVESILSTGRKQVFYTNQNTADQEIPAARAALSRAAICVAEVLENSIRKKEINVEQVREAVNPIIESVIRNSDAYLWLSKMQVHDHYSYEHSVQNCGLGIVFGRHIGLGKRDLSTLATGLLLMDIGKIRIPKAILTKQTPLSKEETYVMQKHVAYGVDILRKAKGINEHIINITLTHHERYDGSGYPNGLVGVQTPAFGRMAAIIDCYDSMITSTPYRKAIPEHKALQNIYNLRDKLFQAELVEQFIQCMGVYPTGSLVELSSGAVAAVLAQNEKQKMRPRVVMMLDADKRPVKKREVVDLAKLGGKALHIASSLEKSAYGLDISAVKF